MLKLKLQYFGYLMWRKTHWKIPWSWERLKAGGEGDDRGWDDWMASPAQWTWVWVNSGSWWWTGSPGMLQSMSHKESNTTEWLNWTELKFAIINSLFPSLPTTSCPFGSLFPWLKLSVLSSFLLLIPPSPVFSPSFSLFLDSLSSQFSLDSLVLHFTHPMFPLL